MTDLQHYYAPDVIRKQVELTQQLHRTAWADLWAQGIVFFSPELAFQWRARRREVRTFWEPMGDEVQIADLRQDMDYLMLEDEQLQRAYRQAQHAAALRDQWNADHADELLDADLDNRLMEAGLL
jgi:hypothetical protein